MRKGFEHGLHGLHGYFLGTWIFLGVPWCVGVLNTDCTDYTDFFWRRDYSVEFGAPDKPCGVGRADANPKLLLNDT